MELCEQLRYFSAVLFPTFDFPRKVEEAECLNRQILSGCECSQYIGRNVFLSIQPGSNPSKLMRRLMMNKSMDAEGFSIGSCAALPIAPRRLRSRAGETAWRTSSPVSSTTARSVGVFATSSRQVGQSFELGGSVGKIWCLNCVCR